MSGQEKQEKKVFSRRDFLKLAALSAGELILLPKFTKEGQDPNTKPTIEFQENYGSLSFKQKEAIAGGVRDSLAFWKSLGAKGPGMVSNYPFVVMTYTNNETSFVEGKFWIRLQTRDRRTAAHESFHTHGLRIMGLPGFMEAPAVATQMRLYGGSVNSDTPLKITNFKMEGEKFADYDNGAAAMIANYNKAGVAALRIGWDFWVAMNDRYIKYIKNLPSKPFCASVPADQFKNWVEDYQPGLWEELGVQYPVLFSK